MFPLRSSLCAVVLLSTTLAVGHAKTPRESLSAADRQLFAWFDQLGIEDLIHAKLVRVRTGNAYASVSNDKKEHFADEPRAFLLWEKGDQFRALLGDLTVATFEKRGKDAQDREYIGWRAVSPDEETAAVLRLLAKKEFDGFWDDGHDTYSDRLDPHGQAFVLARYCAANGRPDLAARLLRATEQRLRKEKHETLQAAVAEEIGGALTWRATLAWSDPQQNRHALAALLQNIVTHCPGIYRSDWIAKTAAVLERMALEDDRHPKLSDAEFERLSPAEQARELVFQLRDDNQNFEEMWPRPWPFAPTRGNGAMKKLQALGLPAVPELLTALEDNRPTRSVFRNHRYGGGIWLDDMKELACQTLNGIAGVNFHALTQGRTYEENWERWRALAKDWWKTTAEKGGDAWLLARVEEGGDNAAYCLDALAVRQPGIAQDLVMRLVPGMKNPRPRAEMLAHLEQTDTPPVNAFLLEEMAHGPTFENRATAARLLHQHHRPEAFAAMLAELAASRERLHEESMTGFGAVSQFHPMGFSGDPDSPIHVLMFLLGVDSEKAIQAVQAALPFCPVFTRSALIEQCSERFSSWDKAKIGPLSPATQEAIEALLLAELNDEDVLSPTNVGGAQDPKIAEIAAVHLAGCFPAKYHFSLSSPLEVRRADLATIRAKTATAFRLKEQVTAPKH